MDLNSSSSNMYDSIIKNRRIKVFLSSTFKDMSEERDYLAKNVFMELQAEALKRNVALNLLDLRWGITAEESKQGLVTEICLKEIEASRPFFIGIIGDRYGWIPKEEDFPANSSLFESFPWIREDIRNGLSITEIEIQYGVLRNKLPIKAFFYIKDDSGQRNDNTAEEAEKLSNLKAQIIAQKEHSVKYYKTANDLGKLIKNDIQEQLNILFPESEEFDEIKDSARIQDSILRTKTEHYIPLKEAFEYIDDFLISPQRLLVITGESGTGKSSLLANWINSRKEFHNIFVHFVDTANSCADYDFILLRLYYYICEQLQIDARIDDDDDDWNNVDIKTKIEKLLETTDKQFVVVIDALNQLNNVKNAYQLEWFPKASQCLKIICSTNDDNYDIIMALAHKAAITYEIPLFKDFESFSFIINGYLRFYGKKLEEEQIQLIFDNELFNNPLLLFTLLEELRIYGEYTTLNKKITFFTKASTELEFFNLVFQRLEEDLSFENTKRDDVGRILFLLAITRNGILNETIAKILDIPQIYVTSLLYRCHRFISVLGQMNSIAHSRIKKAILLTYKEKIGDEVFKKYDDFLNRSITDTKSDSLHVGMVLQLVYLYFHFKDLEKLHKLITSPDPFVILYQFSLNELRQCYVLLSDAGFSILPLTERLGESKLSEIDPENHEYSILNYARKLCLSVHRYDDLSKLLIKSESIYNNTCKYSKEKRILFLCDYLKFCNYTDDISKGIEIAEHLLQETGTSKENDSIRALAYCHKADMLRKTDIKESVLCYNLAIEIYLKNSDSEGAIVSMINAGIGLAQSGNYDDALQMYQNALVLIEEHIKNDPSLIVQKYTCNSNISALYWRMGDNENEYEYKRAAILCYLQIRASEYESLLSPTSIISEQTSLGYMMMRNGKISKGISELKNALKKLDQYKSNISDTEFATHRFEIFMDIAKGYACNQQYIEAVRYMLPIDNEIATAYREQPYDFAERYLLYLKTMANLMSDLCLYETASFYFQKSIDEYNKVKKIREIGIISYLADSLRRFAHCQINQGDIADGLINLEKAANEYDHIMTQDSTYFQSFVDTMIDYFYVTEHSKNIDDYTLEFFEKEYNQIIEKIESKSEYFAYFIFVCAKIIIIHKNRKSIIEAEHYFIILYNVLDRNDVTSKFSKCLFSFIGFCLDELSTEKREQRLLKDSLVYSRMALEFLNATEHIPTNILRITHVFQHCANYHDDVGLKEYAFDYYKQAIKVLDILDENNPNVLFRKAGILYDYGLAMHTVDIQQAEIILNECVELYRHLYDEKSNVAIQYADAEHELANILDDTKRFSEAEKHYRSSIHVLEDFDDEPLALKRLGVALNNYGIMLLKQTRISEARKVLLHSREIRLQADPYGVVRTDDSLYRMALYEENKEEAYIYLKEILKIQEEFGVISCGLLNEFTNYTENFAQLCLDMKKIEEAKQAYKKVYYMIHDLNKTDKTDEMKENERVVKNRILELFNTTDFLD